MKIPIAMVWVWVFVGKGVGMAKNTHGLPMQNTTCVDPGVFSMCMFVDWQVDVKYSLRQKIGWVPSPDPSGEILHGLIQPHVNLRLTTHSATYCLSIFGC